MIEKILQDLLELGNKYQKRKQEEEEKRKQIQQQLQSHAETAKSKLKIIDKTLPNAETKIHIDENKATVITNIGTSPEHGCAVPYQLGIVISHRNGEFLWHILGHEIKYDYLKPYELLKTEKIINDGKRFSLEDLEIEISKCLQNYYKLCKERL